MSARRLTLAYAVRDPEAASRRAADGRMGYLLFRRGLARRLVMPQLGRRMFAVGGTAEKELLDELPASLDRIDAWIADGVLGAEELSAADFMVAPSLALVLYRPDVAGALRGPTGARAGGPAPARAGRGGVRPWRTG